MIPPKVSIIMATYNRAYFILETLLSIQKQTFLDWECLIIDDGGTDNTKEVITPILEQDARFQLLTRSTVYAKGLPGCRNYGLNLAKGDYIVFFDDDDIVHPNNLKISIEVIQINNTDFCHYQKEAFQKGNPIITDTPVVILKSITKDDITDIITQKIGLASCTVVWKRKCFEAIRFNESLLYAEEWECYSRIISENYKGIMIGNVLYFNRKHSNSNTGQFFSNNPVRRSSYVEAILLVVQNLKEKRLVTLFLKRYFITISRDFAEYNLFEAIMDLLELPIFEKFKWKLFYFTFPIRLIVYKIKIKFQK